MWAMGCICVVYTGLLEYCAVLYVSNIPKFMQKSDNVGDKSKKVNWSKIVIVNDFPKLEEQQNSEEVCSMNMHCS